jgi:hypothetical protein
MSTKWKWQSPDLRFGGDDGWILFTMNVNRVQTVSKHFKTLDDAKNWANDTFGDGKFENLQAIEC